MSENRDKEDRTQLMQKMAVQVNQITEMLCSWNEAGRSAILRMVIEILEIDPEELY